MHKYIRHARGKTDLGDAIAFGDSYQIRGFTMSANDAAFNGLSGSNRQQSMGSVGLDYNGGRVRWSLDACTQHEDTRNFRPQFSIGSLVMPEAPSGKTTCTRAPRCNPTTRPWPRASNTTSTTS